MKKTCLILNLILILNINVYSIDYPNKLDTSKHKSIRTDFLNFKNNVKITTKADYDISGRIIHYKHEYMLNNSIDVFESIYHHYQNRTIEEIYEKGKFVEKKEIRLSDDQDYLGIKTLFHKEKSKYKDIVFTYENGVLKSIFYLNQTDKSKYEKEDFYYEINNLVKIVHSGNDCSGSDKEYKYNKNNQVIKEIWNYDRKIIRSIDYNYNSLLQLNSKVYSIYSEDKIINCHFDYYYDENGEIIKELLFVGNELESEKKFLYE